MPIQRSAIILRNEQDEIALIRRDKPNETYYVFPGGGKDDGESLEETAIREAHEELGVDVELNGIAAIVRFNGFDNPYFWAKAIGGRFGTGMGEEFEEEGSGYTPVWIKRSELPSLPIRPPSLAKQLAEMTEPFYKLILSENE
ncbi:MULTISPECIES: NUDIX domain-containing protein [unclassified Exiguobacterium]|uniref:NUDIX hydrolase n=2 Tax=Exiguobacterium TaxID=33986 RepID=UPI00044CA0E3|nr:MULTISPECIES: NUDIX domain-containing protein [unclassified Exiguobacterium]EZP58667.1 NUDIX hydrolase-like protein [Exiguobacterium sp. RIT341]MDT0173366.1 NUDIX domain-containing protein [Exiguobacterium sp. BRG2]HAB34415.1 NUDIX domain-containing protein [Exiguobacterium sp.]HAL01439.1 NUDIX domain-containing protein [Exiguobacterium sp.]HAZ39487.1 NUDIX domain-containing protein [Exiguobacterium sp.]